MTSKAKTMANAFKGALGANLHWYWSILLFRIEKYLLPYYFTLHSGLTWYKVEPTYFATYTTY